MPQISIKGPPEKITILLNNLRATGKPVAHVVCNDITYEDWPKVIKSIFKQKGTALVLDNFDRLSDSDQNYLLGFIKQRNSSNLIFTVESA